MALLPSVDTSDEPMIELLFTVYEPTAAPTAMNEFGCTNDTECNSHGYADVPRVEATCFISLTMFVNGNEYTKR